MKKLNCLFFLIPLISLIGCDKTDESNSRNIDVKTYIKLLKENQYNSSNLPSFTYKDIPALLEYRNETQVITKLPQNPFSSLSQAECKLGVYVLWTIESIRAVSVGSEMVVMRFPSLNPVLY